jgi:GNAT superfamily N-acetyltransferase
VAFATVGPCRDADGSGELYALYADPDHWGTGAGRILIADARARLAADHFGTAVLWVLAGNERAERFYRQDGWTRDGTRRRAEVWGIEVDEVRYERPLP